LKAQRRHELKESELAKDLGKAGRFIKDNLRSLTMSLVILIAVILLVVVLINRHIESRQAEWRDFYIRTAVPQMGSAQTRAELQSLAEQTSQDDLAAWIYVRIGDLATVEWSGRQYELSSAQSAALQREAKTAFETVITRYGDHVRAVAKAHLGLGRLAESTGDIEGARAAYQVAADLQSQGAGLVAAEALRRQAQLDTLPAEAPMAQRPAPETQPTTQPTPTTQPDGATVE